MCCKCDGNAASAEDPKWYFTEETQEACAWLVAKLRREQGIPDANVLRHYDIVNKICPAPYVHNNKYWTSWTWAEFKDRVRYYAGKMELKPGMKVKLTQNIAIRSGVSTKTRQAGYVKYKNLSASIKKKCKRLAGGKAQLKAGNVVEIRNVVVSYDGNIWIEIKSGWLPVYVKGVWRVTVV